MPYIIIAVKVKKPYLNRMQAEWSFYGRAAERAKILPILDRGRWFFCAITGRRRIGKTTLIRTIVADRNIRTLYVQIPDSDTFGVIQAMRDAIEDHKLTDLVDATEIKSLADVAQAIAALCRKGCVVVLDEFQYFHRKALSEFTSFLQAQVDILKDEDIRGGLFVLGSIHTEMTAVLEDKASPLFNRVTDRLELLHWDFATLVEMFTAHGIADPNAWLFYWTLFEGVPKFYNDAWQQAALSGNDGYRETALRKLFLDGVSPLRDEANNWFLGELRGRYDSVLKVLAANQPCAHSRLTEAFKTEAGDEKQLGGHIKVLTERYRIISVRKPIFSKETSRNSRYEISDNFLSSWLTALKRSADLARLRPIEDAIAHALPRIENMEGLSFEKLVRQVLQEASQKGRAPIKLSAMVEGWWDKPDAGQSHIEIDIIAIDDIVNKHIIFGSCKRSASKHTGESFNMFREHVAKFLATSTGKPYRSFRHDFYAISPQLDAARRKFIRDNGLIPLDLIDLSQMVA